MSSHLVSCVSVNICCVTFCRCFHLTEALWANILWAVNKDVSSLHKTPNYSGQTCLMWLDWISKRAVIYLLTSETEPGDKWDLLFFDPLIRMLCKVWDSSTCGEDDFILCSGQYSVCMKWAIWPWILIYIWNDNDIKGEYTYFKNNAVEK